MTKHKINIGLTEQQRHGVMNLLNQDLADAYVLLVKTKKYHWDVVGPQFRTLHKLWEEHYQELTINIDKIDSDPEMKMKMSNGNILGLCAQLSF